MINTKFFLIAMMGLIIIQSCGNAASHEEMTSLLRKNNKVYQVAANQWYPEGGLAYVDSLMKLPNSSSDQKSYGKYLKANFMLELGNEDEAIMILEQLTKEDTAFALESYWKDLGLAYLRKGERSNCISNHAAESCIVPIRGVGIHMDPSGSEKAIRVLESILSKKPEDLESRWLLNLAYMTLGMYPHSVPPKFLIPGMEGDTTFQMNPFIDIAADLKLDTRDMAGGSIVEDFDNDGYLDIMTSCWATDANMHYFKNNADGTFTDLSDKVGLEGITGGLNIMQADYNNDGNQDVFVLRGAWKREFGKEPNSLLRNNGDGTFTDVTTKSGLLSFHPTQTATWNDFNNDGWLDLFIGNETEINDGSSPIHPCELYINNQDGTFREIGHTAHCDILSYVKGVSSGDYDNDGWKDIFVSTMSGQRGLLKNMGQGEKEIVFADMTSAAGLDKEFGNSFPAWFWDYDNDGWLDIFACDYSFEKTLGHYVAAEKLGIAAGNPQKMLLYRNNRDGTFTNVASEVGLNTNVFAMGSNFGDIDNDGFLDMYFGTGSPDYRSVVPNKMFKNLGGQKFVDVTASARVGHLQKGHGVSFADLDNDGDQDMHIEMGGAFQGDSYQNSFFMNPGQNDNKWINLRLEGQKSNRAAIGTRLKLTFRENGISRSVYRDVNTGGSFGSSPLRREIGIGQATIIDEIEIRWHGSGEVQVFKDVQPNQFIRIREGIDRIEVLDLKVITWTLPEKLCLPEAPVAIKLTE